MQTKEHSILSLNIDDLRKYQNTEHCSIYKGVLACRSHSMGTSNDQLFSEPIRLNMITFILGTKGEKRLQIDQHEIDLNEHTLVIIPPRSIVSSSHLSEQHYLERQPVTFYANRLCISARYLTTIVRRVSGMSVSHWMNRYILTEAKYLLKYSELSIQEIAYKLSFPNQSFFGKYFKQHTGSSPSSYRAQL